MSLGTSEDTGARWRAFCETLFSQNLFAIKLGLEPMQQALSALGDPHTRHLRVAIAGTNGKGSTASLLSSILMAHGLDVGVYTSPHLIDVRERFRVNGRPIPLEVAMEVCPRIFERFGREGAEPRVTFFELTTLMATELFANSGVDVGIYEVGLGGRLDAVNALDADVSLFTTLGYDHMQYLGETLDEIAREKAGIARRGRPAVLGAQEYDEASGSLLRHVRALGAHPIIQLTSRDEHLHPEARPWWRTHVFTALEGAMHVLGPSRYDPAIAHQAIARARWPGRTQFIELPGGQVALLDAAHNPDGVRALSAWLDDEGLEPAATLFAVMRDKAYDSMLEELGRRAPIHPVLLENPRAARAEHYESAASAGLVHAPESLALALERVSMLETSRKRPILVCGSIYLLGELFAHTGVTPDDLTLT